MTQSTRTAIAALSALTLLHVIMLLSLFAGVAPHPPAKIVLFGMAPFVTAVLCAATAAMILGPIDTRAGRILTVLTGLLSLISFGPHKLLDPTFPLIWPAWVTTWVALAALVIALRSNAQRQPR